jgi:hypothetical protein
MTLVETRPSTYGVSGELVWTKLDIDLQGQNLMDDFGPLQRKLLEVRSKEVLSKDDLEELTLAAAHTKNAAENLLRRIWYLRKNLEPAAA